MTLDVGTSHVRWRSRRTGNASWWPAGRVSCAVSFCRLRKRAHGDATSPVSGPLESALLESPATISISWGPLCVSHCHRFQWISRHDHAEAVTFEADATYVAHILGVFNEEDIRTEKQRATLSWVDPVCSCGYLVSSATPRRGGRCPHDRCARARDELSLGVRAVKHRGGRPRVGERKSLEAMQAAAREAAETANLLKEKFLALLSHELRTPLNLILGYARMLQDDAIPPETRRLAAERIERNAVALNRLIEDLLDFSRITSGNVRLETQPVPVMAPFREALASVGPALEAKRLGIEIGGEPFGSLVNGDPHRLRQIFWNVLSNAVKFTPEGGRIDATFDMKNTLVCVLVRDTGIGISREFMPRLFEPFRQADRQFARQFSGLGLGLSICKHLVELHGGTITATSDGADRGTTIEIRLPACVSPSTACEAGRAAELERPLPSPAERPGPNSLAGVDALVVDDDQDMLEFCATFWTVQARRSERRPMPMRHCGNGTTAFRIS